MPDPFIGEIRMFAGNFAPVGWAGCDGQLLSIVQNQALFSLLGTNYGGDGVTTFGLPDLRGRSPIHAGVGPGLAGISLGQKGGVESVSLTSAQMPAHNHSLMGSGSAGASSSPAGQLSAEGNDDTYATASPVAMAASAIGTAGAGQAHENRSPYLAITYIIALVGIFPTHP